MPRYSHGIGETIIRTAPAIAGAVTDIIRTEDDLKTSALNRQIAQEELGQKMRQYEYQEKLRQEKESEDNMPLTEDMVFAMHPNMGENSKNLFKEFGKKAGLWESQPAPDGKLVIKKKNLDKGLKMLETNMNAAKKIAEAGYMDAQMQLANIEEQLASGKLKPEQAQALEQQKGEINKRITFALKAMTTADDEIKHRQSIEKAKVDEDKRIAIEQEKAALKDQYAREKEPTPPMYVDVDEEGGRVQKYRWNPETRQHDIPVGKAAPKYKPSEGGGGGESKKEEKARQKDLEKQRAQYRTRKAALDKEYAIVFQPQKEGYFGTSVGSSGPTDEEKKEYTNRLEALKAEYDPEIFEGKTAEPKKAENANMGKAVDFLKVKDREEAKKRIQQLAKKGWSREQLSDIAKRAGWD